MKQGKPVSWWSVSQILMDFEDLYIAFGLYIRESQIPTGAYSYYLQEKNNQFFKSPKKYCSQWLKTYPSSKLITHSHLNLLPSILFSTNF